MTRATAEGVQFDGISALPTRSRSGALRGLTDTGIRVPDEVKVIGFDGITEADYAVPRAGLRRDGPHRS